jgi:hypothetical protein
MLTVSRENNTLAPLYLATAEKHIYAGRLAVKRKT